jgi:hypothetical protein
MPSTALTNVGGRSMPIIPDIGANETPLSDWEDRRDRDEANPGTLSAAGGVILCTLRLAEVCIAAGHHRRSFNWVGG